MEWKGIDISNKRMIYEKFDCNIFEITFFEIKFFKMEIANISHKKYILY